MPQISILIFTRTIGLIILKITFMDHFIPSRILMSNFKSWNHNFAQPIDQMTKNQLYWVKNQLWSTYSQTSRFLTNINILKSYSSIYQAWITIPHEKCSNHQRGKMVKIRVLIENDWFLTFYLIHDLLTWGIILRIQRQHLDLIPWLNSFLKIKQLIVEIWSTNEKVNWYTKSQTLTFWSTLSFKDQDSSRHSKI